jgi:hypothetical protein
MVQDDWWEVQAQLIVVACKLLGYMDQNDESQPSAQVYDLLRSILQSREHNTNLKKIALSYIAPLLATHDSLVDTFVGILLEIPEYDRLALLEQPSDSVNQVQVGSSLAYQIVSIPYNWDSLAVAKSLTNIIKEHNLSLYELQHYDIMNTCVSTVGELSDREDMIPWETVFVENQNLLFAGLSDEENCEVAADLILKFYVLLQADALKSIPLLLKAIETIFQPRSKSVRSRDALTQFLIALYSQGEPFTHTLEKLASTSLSESHLAQTELAEFLRVVAQRR